MIDSRFTDDVYVQASTTAADGKKTWADKAGHNMGYKRPINSRDKTVAARNEAIVTWRFVMTCDVVPVAGNRLRVGTSYYMVKFADAHALSGGVIQIVDCEVAT